MRGVEQVGKRAARTCGWRVWAGGALYGRLQGEALAVGASQVVGRSVGSDGAGEGWPWAQRRVAKGVAAADTLDAHQCSVQRKTLAQGGGSNVGCWLASNVPRRFQGCFWDFSLG